LQVAWRQPLV